MEPEKIFSLNMLIAFVRKNNEVAIASAGSGVAPSMLLNGSTARSLFLYPFDINESSACKSGPKGKRDENFIAVKLIVCDEVPMLIQEYLDMTDQLLRDLTQNSKPFGGKLVMPAGDFRQVVPIIRKATGSQIVDPIIKKSDLWYQC